MNAIEIKINQPDYINSNREYIHNLESYIKRMESQLHYIEYYRSLVDMQNNLYYSEYKNIFNKLLYYLYKISFLIFFFPKLKLIHLEILNCKFLYSPQYREET